MNQPLDGTVTLVTGASSGIGEAIDNLTRDRRVAVNEMLVRAAEQTW